MPGCSTILFSDPVFLTPPPSPKPCTVTSSIFVIYSLTAQEWSPMVPYLQFQLVPTANTYLSLLLRIWHLFLRSFSRMQCDTRTKMENQNL